MRPFLVSMPATIRSEPMAARELGGEGCVDCSLGREERRTDDDALCSGVEDLAGALDRVNASAGLHWEPLGNLLDKRGVVALAHRRIEVDQLD